MPEKEEIILEVKIEQSDALTEMERLKKSIVQTKQEQAELNKAFKAGNITLDEYAQDSVRLEGILKKNQSAYNNVQKSVTGVKTQLDKLIDSNQKISKDLQKTSQSFQDVASNINVAGVNVGSLTTKFASFANPATAAVGIVGALGAAYARSTIGAKDLEFAQNQLNTAITIGTNAFANLISSSEDGEGIFSKITAAIIFRIDSTTGALSRLAAFNAEALEDLGRTELEIREKVNQRLEENQELLTEIQSDQTDLNEKLANGDQIITNVRRNEEELKDVLEEELSILNDQLRIDNQNESIQTAILQKKLEISKLERDSEKRVQNIVKLQDNLNDAEAKRLLLLSQQRAITNSGNRNIDITSGLNLKDQSGVTNRPKEESVIAENTLGIIDAQKALKSASEKLGDEIVGVQQTQYARDLQNFIEVQDAKRAAMNATVQAAKDITGALAGVADEGTALQKGFALTSIAIDTGQAIAGLTAASEENPANGVSFGAAGIAQYAAGLIRILANIAAAKNYLGDRAAGGGDFMTNGPTMLMVGDNPGGVERVTVEPLSGKGKTYVSPNSNLVAMAGGGSLTTYPGLIANSVNQDTNNTLAQTNMMKRVVKSMPPPVVSAKEMTRVQNRVKVKERISKSG
jgi:uncharacterized protein YoxC